MARGRRLVDCADTFFQKQLVASGYNLKDMAMIIGCSYRYAVAYFSGNVMPTASTIRIICDTLGVDYEKGVQEFIDAYDAWGEAHKDTHVKFSNTYKPKASKAKYANVEYKRHKVRWSFWRTKISGYGVSVKDLAKFLNKSTAVINNYLSGHIMPDDDVIKFFCNKFNVNHDRAYAEFRKEFDRWTEEHAKTHEVVGNYHVLKDHKSVEKPNAIEQKGISMDAMKCLQLVYGKLSYEDFQKVSQLHTSYMEFIEFLYGKVDFDTFRGIVGA